MPIAQSVIDALAAEWLGKNGVVAVADGTKDARPVILFYVVPWQSTMEGFPQQAFGYEIMLVKSAPIVFQD